MSLTESHHITPAQNLALSAETIRWIRLSIGAVAVLAVVALGALGGQSDIQSPDQSVNQTAEQPTPGFEPVFDGRGKWGGYAR